MSDIEKSFAFLHDNIPSWFDNIGKIEEKVAAMKDEMAKAPVSRSLPLKRRTGSVESIRDLDAVMEDQTMSTAAQQPSAANRKRKTPSVLSGHASGPTKYRSRTMIIVSYDGQVQKSFETLVRSIGTGRNMLRKGKMAAKLEALAELEGSEDDDDGDDDAIMSKIGYRHRAGLSSMRTRGAIRGGRDENTTSSSVTPIEIFDSTDKALEHAQGLCERAAHQSLRDGNCRKELKDVRKHFEDVMKTVNEEVAKSNARKEKEVAKGELKIESTPQPEVTPKPMLPKVEVAPTLTPTVSKAVDIEVDDDEDDDMDFVMPPIRLTSRA